MLIVEGHDPALHPVCTLYARVWPALWLVATLERLRNYAWIRIEPSDDIEDHDG